MADAYARRLGDPNSDLDDREQAAVHWDEWESQHIRLDPLWTLDARHDDLTLRRVFATLVTHYWTHDGFLVGPDTIANKSSASRAFPPRSYAAATMSADRPSPRGGCISSGRQAAWPSSNPTGTAANWTTPDASKPNAGGSSCAPISRTAYP